MTKTVPSLLKAYSNKDSKKFSHSSRILFSSLLLADTYLLNITLGNGFAIGPEQHGITTIITSKGIISFSATSNTFPANDQPDRPILGVNTEFGI